MSGDNMPSDPLEALLASTEIDVPAVRADVIEPDHAALAVSPWAPSAPPAAPVSNFAPAHSAVPLVPAYAETSVVPAYGEAYVGPAVQRVDVKEPGFIRNVFGALSDHRSVVGVALAVVLVGVGGFAFLGTRGDLSSTRSELSAVRTELTRTKSELADADARATALAKDRDDAKAMLLAKTGEADGVRQSLSDANHRVDLQAGQITTLKTCLTGVAQALVDASYGDYVSAGRSLQAVRAACESSDALF